MPISPRVLFDLPQHELASLLVQRLASSISTSIVTGFATPGGLAAISGPLKAHPKTLKTLIIGAATYPAFETLDQLIAADVDQDALFVHLGHTSETNGKKNPFARYHPMLHSKIYFMELPSSKACAFIGSNNLTSFALTGLNGEASVMLEGPSSSVEFDKVRSHIAEAQKQAVQYSPEMKDAYAWWMREFIDGMRVEIGIPLDWISVRTILLFAEGTKGDRPKSGEHLYFEIPAGIEQIDSLKTEAHLYLFESLPNDPWKALQQAAASQAQYTCTTLGVENRQGNLEVTANWYIEGRPRPVLRRVSTGTVRPTPPNGMQQVRAEVIAPSIKPYEYQFERERNEWNPKLSDTDYLTPAKSESDDIVGREARGGNTNAVTWKLVKGLVPRANLREKDQAALSLAAPESGAFILVSLRRRSKNRG